MTFRISFVASATETLTAPGLNPSGVALPAVDSNNPDITISHTSASPILVLFGPGAVAGPNATGAIQVPPGYAVLLTSNATVLGAAKDALVQGGAQAALAGSQTNVSIYTPCNCQVTLARGTASAVQSF